MECFPNVSRHVDAYLLILVATKPLSQALDVDVGHRSRTFAWRNERIVLLKFVGEADSAHCPGALRHITPVLIAILITWLTLVVFYHCRLFYGIDTLPLLCCHLVCLVLVHVVCSAESGWQTVGIAFVSDEARLGARYRRHGDIILLVLLGTTNACPPRRSAKWMLRILIVIDILVVLLHAILILLVILHLALEELILVHLAEAHLRVVLV